MSHDPSVYSKQSNNSELSSISKSKHNDSRINKQSVSKVIMMTHSGGTIHKQAYVISHVTTGKCRQKKKKGEACGAVRERQGKGKISGKLSRKRI